MVLLIISAFLWLVFFYGIALFIASTLLNKSNNYGDSKSDVDELSKYGMVYLEKIDRCISTVDVDFMSDKELRIISKQ